MAKVKKTTTQEGVTSFDFKNIESQLESVITKNLPALPQNAIDTLVSVSPWLAVVSTVMGVRAIMALLRMNQFAAYYNVPGMGFGWSYQIGNIFMIVQMVLTGLSIQGLFARKISAWRLMYYASWISIVSSLLSGQVINMFIVGFISFYILFQVKKSYK